MNAKKHILSIPKDSTSVLFGIATHFNEIEFCNLLQRELGIDLKVQEQLSLEYSPQKKVSYSVYSYTNKEKMITFDLVHNRTSNGSIVSFLDTITYFLRCSADYIDIESKSIYKQLSSLEKVLFVQKIEDANFNTKQNNLIQSIFPLR